MRKAFAVLTVAILAAGPAWAGGPKEGSPGTNVEMPFLIAPMSKDGKLLGYSYIQGKIVATSQSSAMLIGDKLAFILDAFVRDVNGAPIGKAGDPTVVDVDKLNQRLTADAKRVVGDDRVVGMVFTDEQGKPDIKFAPLHPGDSTLNLVPPSDAAPGADAAPAPSAAKPADTAAAQPAPATSQTQPSPTH